MRTHSKVVKDLRSLTNSDNALGAGDIVDAIYGCIMAEPDTPTYEPDSEQVLNAIRECLSIWDNALLNDRTGGDRLEEIKREYRRNCDPEGTVCEVCEETAEHCTCVRCANCEELIAIGTASFDMDGDSLCSDCFQEV